MPAQVRKLFHLTDVDNDGFVSLEEFVLMGLHQKKLHTKKPMTWKDEERIKNGLVRRFREIDSSFQAVPYYKYKEYMLRSVGEMHPGDLEALGMEKGNLKPQVVKDLES